MKTSVRNKRFTAGMILFLLIILLLAVLSAFYLTRLSGKTSAILKENHYSVVYARSMSEALTEINQKVLINYPAHENFDTLVINKELRSFDQSLMLEKNNITEIGEDTLVADIESNFREYCDSVVAFGQTLNGTGYYNLQTKYNNLYQQLMLLSRMNEKAIEAKTNDARVSARKFSMRMSVIGTFCFLIAYAFTFSFSSYFNERFYSLYDGLKEMAANNFREKLLLEGEDEIAEISLIINEMAEKLTESDHKKSLPLQIDSVQDSSFRDIQELKEVLAKMKTIEYQAIDLISKIEKNNI